MLKQVCAYVMQDDVILGAFTVREMLGFFLDLRLLRETRDQPRHDSEDDEGKGREEGGGTVEEEKENRSVMISVYTYTSIEYTKERQERRGGNS